MHCNRASEELEVDSTEADHYGNVMGRVGVRALMGKCVEDSMVKRSMNDEAPVTDRK
jgi:hypothetical protein